MKQYLILCRSVTHAQRCARLLEGVLIRAAVTKAPRELTSSGCGYALLLHAKLDEALRLLRKKEMSFGRGFERDGDGEYRALQP